MINYFNSRVFQALFLSLCLAFSADVLANDQEEIAVACKNDNAAAVAKFFEKGLDPNSLDASGTPLIVLATTHGAGNVIRMLASNPKINLNNTGKNGESALAVAAYKNNREVLDLLLSKGALLETPGWTAMHYAASAGHLDMVQYLISKKATLDPLSANKTTPMMMAARSRHTHVVKALLEAGANPAAKNDSDLTTADYLDRHKETELAEQVRKRLPK